jgi:hypothetical protein
MAAAEPLAARGGTQLATFEAVARALAVEDGLDLFDIDDMLVPAAQSEIFSSSA